MHLALAIARLAGATVSEKVSEQLVPLGDTEDVLGTAVAGVAAAAIFVDRGLRVETSIHDEDSGGKRYSRRTC